MAQACSAAEPLSAVSGGAFGESLSGAVHTLCFPIANSAQGLAALLRRSAKEPHLLLLCSTQFAPCWVSGICKSCSQYAKCFVAPRVQLNPL